MNEEEKKSIVNMTRIHCLDCKNKFVVDEGTELLVHCPACGSSDLRWIIGSFLDSATIREVRVKRLIKRTRKK